MSTPPLLVPNSASDDLQEGSVSAFRSSWSQYPIDQRYHFKRGQPQNQVQFAFQNHWRVFRQVLGNVRTGRVLEVGCGRGSMGAFFADGGFDAYLLDTSDVALHIARANFEADDLAGHPVCGDALALPYPSGVFDVVVSIGLLEHFADITQLLQDQLRVLRPGGVFLGYVVPERTFSVQTLAVPINLVLRMAYAIYKVFKPVSKKGSRSAKAALYRNRFVAADYLAVLRQTGIQEAGSFGMFPVPLVSQSPAFPFSPMTPALERILVRIWQRLLSLRRRSSDPWICREGWGLAFLVWARK